jgi:hypothetical protein
MGRASRSTPLEQFTVPREHIFQNPDGDEILESAVEARARMGIPMAPLWAKWLSMNDTSDKEPTDAVRNVTMSFFVG